MKYLKLACRTFMFHVTFDSAWICIRNHPRCPWQACLRPQRSRTLLEESRIRTLRHTRECSARIPAGACSGPAKYTQDKTLIRQTAAKVRPINNSRYMRNTHSPWRLRQVVLIPFLHLRPTSGLCGLRTRQQTYSRPTALLPLSPRAISQGGYQLI